MCGMDIWTIKIPSYKYICDYSGIVLLNNPANPFDDHEPNG
jgi:hypothetical protein